MKPIKPAIAHATVVVAIGVLPVFLVGALVIQLRHDLDVQVQDIGIATAALFASTALMARLGARLVQRYGSGWAMAIAPTISTAALLVGAFASSFAMLAVAMVIGGVGNAVAQPVANQRLAEFVTPDRLGMAFGLKQASVPAAALFAGIAVPSIAIGVGWRWVWIVAAAAAALTAFAGLLTRASVPPLLMAAPNTRGDMRLGRKTMLWITVSAFLAATVGTSVGVFFVDSAVQSGFDAAGAGVMYAGFSVLGILTRIVLGWYSDRRPRQNSYMLIAMLFSMGVAGCLLFAVGGTWEFIVGGLLTYVLGWAWPGVLHFAIVRDNRSSVAAATGFLQSGSSMGAGLGPLFFGFLVSATSFGVGWLVAAGIGAAAAILMVMGSRSARNTPLH